MIVKISKFTGENIEEANDEVAEEINLKIYINDKFFVNLKCSPGYEKELAIGFLISEGILEKGSIKDIKFNKKINSAYIYTDDKNYEFKFSLSSDCINKYIPKRIIEKIFVKSDLKISKEIVFDGMRKLYINSNLWKKTGGTHIGAFFDGKNFIFVEDISRYITLDKLIGIGINKNLDFSKLLFLTSGRIAGDIISKIACVGIPFAITRTSVTDKAIEAAENCNITLIGFVRGNRFNVYTHKERII